MAEEQEHANVMRAVTELRQLVESKSSELAIEKEKAERINAYLDGAEEAKQEVAKLLQQDANHKAELKELKEAYEKAGATATEAQSRIDALEAEIARGLEAKKAGDEDFRQKDGYKALQEWCQKGDKFFHTAPEEKAALLRTDVNVDGGFLTTQEMDSEITKKIIEIDAMRVVARVRTISAKSMVMAIRDTIPSAAYEGEAETGTDSVSSYTAETIVPFRQTFTVPITIDMLQDAAFDMDSEISTDSAEAFAFGEGVGFITGSGFKQPFGVLSDPRVTGAAFPGTSGTSGELDPDDPLLMTGQLKTGYNASFLLNRRVLATIRTFKSTTGAYLWMPGLNGPVANTIAGEPYFISNSVPDEGSDNYPLLYGDWRRGYTITDRTGMSIIRDEYTQKKRAIVEFTMNRWNTGQVTLPEAIVVCQVPT